MRYRDDTKLILQDISFQVKSNEKIGLIGRTGSGKSSIFLCILRMLELESGQILIDGQDIAQVGLLTLRKKLTIIPQEPVIFLGNLKYNLDPFGEYPNEKLLEILDVTGLTQLLRKQMKKTKKSGVEEEEEQEEQQEDQQEESKILDFMIQEQGGNLSVGERQLICIARAILRNSKIILLDEATSSIDQVTDQKIQTLLREKFQQTTMLIIAHRLETIMDTDRIIRLDNGTIVEISNSKDAIIQPGQL